MSDRTAAIWWVRKDLRLSDNPALTAAVECGGPVIPVFIRDWQVDALGAAPKWRLEQGLHQLEKSLRDKGSRLIVLSGPSKEVLCDLAKETGAKEVHWNRTYDPEGVERDTAVKSSLEDMGVKGQGHAGHLLFEPWTVETKQGGYYKVYTPFWRAVKSNDISEALSTPGKIPAPDQWPDSQDLSELQLGKAMYRGADVVARFARVGESAAHSRLGAFVASIIEGYDETRDLPWKDGTSNLSENLALGEISPRQCWHAGVRAREDGKAGAETFLKELVWREFAYHLMWHTPQILTENWKSDWDAFPWNTDERKAEVQAWKHGRTGIQFVDAALREMYVTGRMHNRGRMIVASYLCKHLMCHWKIGLKWFEDCLIDWDPASNAMGWQWSAGSGPDATPYFRVFNPVTQLDKFDKDRKYVKRWIAEGRKNPHEDALAYFDAIPKTWGLSPDDTYPDPVVTADKGRQRALDAYENRDF